ncbi:MAG: CHAD domain-containing protein [Pseudomonadota bacterium]
MKVSKQSYVRYLMPENMTKKHFLDSLKKSFVVNEVISKTETFSIIESFSWDLHKNRLMAIQHQNNNISLWNEQDLLDPDLSMDIGKINCQAKFWWDFPDSPARNILQDILKLRALYPVYHGLLKIEQFNLEDNDGKILVFCQLISIADPSKPRTYLMRQAKLIPVTGYTNENKYAIERLKELGGFKPKLPPLDSLLSAIGVTPQPFTIKPVLSISPDMPAREAASYIIAIMMEKQRLTEAGIIKDIDSEYLHHYRVALRMIRAAIVQLKEVFPEKEVVLLKQRFGSLAKETNYLRDIDVFLLDKNRYMNFLPESLRNGLLPMFSDFEISRVKEVKRISSWLSGKIYQQEMSELQSLFEKGYSTIETQWSERPSIELAVKKIQKRYKKIQIASTQITQSTPDEGIHSIRIECKKLRYLLYFFGNLFNKKQVKVAEKHLKSLQDKLGIFNDLAIQGEFLENYLNETEHKQKKDMMLIAALGGLISTLYTMQMQERNQCINELVIFSNTENRQLFKETFNH